MNVHLVGTSQLLPLRAMAHDGAFDPDRICRWYYLNNSGYAEGDFSWTADGLSHTSPTVLGRWKASSGRTFAPVGPADAVIAFGFDDRIGRYGFLAGKADHVSNACRAQTVRDIIAASPAFRLMSLLGDKRPEVERFIVEPPLLSRQWQQRKFGDTLVLERRYREIAAEYARAADALGARYMPQPEETLLMDGGFLCSRSDMLAPDGFHWSESGIDIVRRDIEAALRFTPRLG